MRNFQQLFRGRDDVFGTYRLPTDAEAVEGQKLLGQGRTAHAALTAQHYEDHLAGKESIGVIPILKTNDCWWFAIDVDRYDNPDQHYEFEKKIQKLSLPIVVSRSKSNGVHLWCFLTKPASAKLCMETAKQWCKLLGLGKVEIFPKQEKVRPGDDGNWINLPYFGNTRVAIGLKGEDLTLQEFLELAHAREINPRDLGESAAQAEKAVDAGEHAGAPPCIQTMLRDGIQEGGRDDRLIHIGVYLKKAFPDNWQERLSEINAEVCEPPVKFSDLARIIGSLERKDYQYRCKILEDICEKPLCKTREFGIGTGESDFVDVMIDRLQKIDSEPPVWIVHMNGKQAKLSTDEIMQPEKFRKAILEKFNRLPGAMTKKAWEKYLSGLLERVEIEAAPEDVSAPGLVMQIFREWTTRMVQNAPTVEKIMDQYPFYMKEEKALVWRGTDLLSQIARVNPGAKIDQKLVWLILRDEGAEIDRLTFNDGKRLRVWKLKVADPWFPLPASASAF